MLSSSRPRWRCAEPAARRAPHHREPLAKEQIWVALSRINEFQEITGRDFAKLEQVLKEHKASVFFADRSDIEIAGEDDVIYGDVVETIELATKVGFTDWKVLPPAGLTARPQL